MIFLNELIDLICKNENITVSSLLSQYDNTDEHLSVVQSRKGFMYETLWNIVIKFGFEPNFPRGKVTHLDGNFSKDGHLFPINSLKSYIKETKIISGSSGGKSDITLQKKDGTYIFISSKYYKDDLSHSVADYDYDIMNSMCKVKGIEKHELWLVVKDKKAVQQNLSKAKSNNHIEWFNRILDESDLDERFEEFKKHVKNYSTTDYDEVFLSTEKLFVKLKFHQDMFVHKTIERIKTGKKRFLYGMKCRSGKTITFSMVIYLMNLQNTLIITPVPTETKNQYKETFDKYREFNEYNIINLTDISLFDIYDQKTVYLASKQFFDHHKNDILTKMDLIIVDEAHSGGTTDKSKKSLTKMLRKDTIVIYCTATPYKPLNAFKIPDDCQYYWTIEDEIFCKTNNTNKLIEKHGEIVKDILPYFDLNEYAKMPFMEYITSRFCDDVFSKLTNILDENSIYGFSFKNLLSCSEDGKFNWPMEVRKFLRYISGSNRIIDFKNGDKSIFKKIENVLKQRNSRSCFTQIWFLPPDGIINTCKNLKELMLEDMVLKEYNILEVHNGVKFNQYSILKAEEEARKKGKIGLIILAGKMLTTGVTIKLCDVVMIFNECRSSDLNYQMIYRCMTEDDGKTCGVIVDFDLNRIIANMINNKPELSFDEAIKYNIINNLINIDSDQFDNCSQDSNKICEQFINLWSQHNNIDKLKKAFKRDLVDLLENLNVYDKKLIIHFIEYFAFQKEEEAKVSLYDDNQKIPSGRLRIEKKVTGEPVDDEKELVQHSPEPEPEPDSENDDNSIGEDVCFDEIEENVVIDEATTIAIFNIIKDVILLVAFWSFNVENREDVSFAESFKNLDDEFKRVLNEQFNICYNKSYKYEKIPIFNLVLNPLTGRQIKYGASTYKKLVSNGNIDESELKFTTSELIENRVDYYTKFDRLFNSLSCNFIDFNLFSSFKMSIRALIDEPAKLIEFINNNLQPKNIEKRKFGEVFTPLPFIETMLTDLELYYQKQHKKYIWSDPTITFFDPANGMGNFLIVVYNKLMKGLENEIPNVLTRKKHIIEKMLYASEINEKNTMITRRIFGKNANIYCGDSLTIDLYKTFGKTQFDVIIGNPPYQTEQTDNSPSASPLYNKFIELFVNKCKIMSFVVPSRWFSCGKGLDKFRKMMLERSDIPMIKHFENASKIFGNKVEIKGGVNYFIIDQNYDGNCKFNGKEITLNAYDVLVSKPEYFNIINNVIQYETIDSIYKGRCFSIETNDKRLTDKKNGYIKCYVSKAKGSEKYIDGKDIKNADTWKVITTRSAHKHESGFGNIFIGKPGEVHTGSYMSFHVQNKNEALSLESYLKCKLPNLLLSLRKYSQDISENTLKWIPLVALDRIWNDNQVYKCFELSGEEIKLVESAKVTGYKPMED